MENKNSNPQVTPWDVNEVVDYDKLLIEFGVKKIDDEDKEYLKQLANEKGLEEHLFLRRGLFYAQMDLKKTLQDHRDGKPIFLYTGRAPGGSMHIAHLISFEFTKYLQDLFDCNVYIQIPDDEKLLQKKNLTPKIIDEMTKSDLDDITALGFNVDKTFIFRNSEFIKNMYSLYLNLARKITFSQFKNTFGFTNETNVGLISMPSYQMVPTFFEKGQCLIPCGIDQNPYFLLQRDYAPKLGYKKNATILSKFLPDLTGPKGKMSASKPDQAILLTDSDNQIKKKINKHAFSGGQETLELHRKLGGNCEIDVSFQWLRILFENDDQELKRIENQYSSGEMLSGELKSILISYVQEKIHSHNQFKLKAKSENLLEKYMYSGKLAKQMWAKDFMND